ncbi:MAG: TIGR03013 family PEP-CTERM/XrtA system glycosyltransferase [Desulfobacterium sp.]|nr:TIGR03013 family PEP-CTERM/XrtA system glycosyltransferase [Desulfobacterium sp.]
MLRLLKQYYPIRNIFFILCECAMIFLSVILACYILLDIPSTSFDPLIFFRIFIIALIVQSCLYFNDLYDIKISDSLKEIGIRLLQALGISAFFLAFLYVIFPSLILGGGVFPLSILFVIIFIIFWRIFYFWVLDRGLFNQKIVLLGSGELSQKIDKEIHDKKDSGYSIAMRVEENQTINQTSSCEYNTYVIKKDFDGLCDIAKAMKIIKIVVAIQEKRGAFPTKELLKCRVGGIEVIDGDSFYEMLTGKIDVGQINPSWLIFSEGFKKSMVRRFIKRSEDLILSFILLVTTAPLFILVAMLIKIDSKGPALYSQERVGKNKKKYKIHKFRSMVADAEKHSGPVWAKDNDDRVTRVGKWLRKTRVDELPQLWNVFKGNMSFVGPRPERDFFVQQLEKAIPYYWERFSVKPGITGWAQVSYSYGDSVEDAVEKLNYDLFYIKNMSTIMDVMITLRTIKTVLFGKGAQ